LSVTVAVYLNEKSLRKKFGLGSGQKAQKYLATRVRQRCDKYVPKDTGLLKNTALVSGSGDSIRYIQPYAKAQFYRNYRHADPRRGQFWHKRMLQREGTALLGDMKRYLEGRPG